MRHARVLLGLAATTTMAAAVAACSIDITGSGDIATLGDGGTIPSDATVPIGDDAAAPDMDAPVTIGQADAEAADAAGDDDATTGQMDASPDDAATTDASDGAATDSGPVLDCDGGACYALAFDNPNDFSGTGSVLAQKIPVIGDFTLEAFVKPTSATLDGGTDHHKGITIFSAPASSGVAESKNDYWVQFFGNGILEAVIGNNNQNDRYTDGTVSLPSNVWMHVAVTRSGSNVNTYINGGNGATPPAATAYGSTTSNTSGNLTDVMNFVVGENFVGIIDDVRVWNDARTQAQVMADSMAVNVPTNDSSLVMYWKFDEGPGSTIAKDSSGGNNNGMLNSGNTPVWVVSDHP